MTQVNAVATEAAIRKAKRTKIENHLGIFFSYFSSPAKLMERIAERKNNDAPTQAPRKEKPMAWKMWLKNNQKSSIDLFFCWYEIKIQMIANATAIWEAIYTKLLCIKNEKKTSPTHCHHTEIIKNNRKFGMLHLQSLSDSL